MKDLKPGRELDALVSEKIFGITPEMAASAWASKNMQVISEGMDFRTFLPKYSTDIASAFEVLKRLEELGWIASIRSQYDVMNDRIVRQVSLFLPGEREVVSYFQDLEFLPQATSLAGLNAVAALKALGAI